MTKEIPLTRGYVALVDDEDFDWLSQWKWCASKAGRVFYAKRRAHPEDGHHAKSIFMHRALCAAPRGAFVDHINGDPLDNRRSNLRVCSAAENSQNRKSYPHIQCEGLKGIHFRYGRWEARITANGRSFRIGRYAEAMSAARAYDAAAIEMHGEFARLNFPDEAA